MLQRDQFETTISTQLMFAQLAEFFGLLAVVLVVRGLYGALSYRISGRTAEIGVRTVPARGTAVITPCAELSLDRRSLRGRPELPLRPAQPL